MAACTIVTKRGLAQARILAKSFLEHHPDAPVFVLLADRIDGYFKPSNERFHLVQLDDLDIPDNNQLPFRYTSTELLTALKPYFLNHLFAKHAVKKLLYLDPASLVLGNLDPLLELLEEHSVVLAPYLTSVTEEDGAPPRDQRMLEVGTHATGFLALAHTPTTTELLDWWQKRVTERGVVIGEQGIAGDQRWFDMLPRYFKGVHVAREPGYGIGSWNVHARQVELREGEVVVNGQQGYFFSFAGLEPADSAAADQFREPQVMAGDSRILLQQYRGLLEKEGREAARLWPYAFDAFDNGAKIPDFVRQMYQRLGREARRFENPFHSSSSDSFFAWLNGSVDGEENRSQVVTRLWHEIYLQRRDLQEAFPDLFGSDRTAFIQWVADHGLRETAVDERFLVHRPLAHRQEQLSEPPREAPVALHETALGVNIAGYIASEKGVGEGVRSDIRMMQAAGIPYVLNNFPDPGSSNQDLTFEHFSYGNPHPINLMHINADAIPEFAPEGKGLLRRPLQHRLLGVGAFRVPQGMASELPILR